MIEYMYSNQAIQGLNIRQDFRLTFQDKNMVLMPFFMAGHPLEIAQRLTDKDKDKVYKYQKYPLIALRMDIQESVSKVSGLSLNILILNYTDKSGTQSKRMEDLSNRCFTRSHERFMEELRNNDLFFWPGNQDYPEHTKWTVPSGVRKPARQCKEHIQRPDWRRRKLIEVEAKSTMLETVNKSTSWQIAHHQTKRISVKPMAYTFRDYLLPCYHVRFIRACIGELLQVQRL